MDYVIIATHQAPEKDVEKRLTVAMKSSSILKIIAHPTGRSFGVRDEAIVNWINVAKVAVKTNTVYGWLRNKKLNGTKLGKLWRVSETEFNSYLNQGKSKPEIN